MKHLILTLTWQVGWTALCLSLSSCHLHAPATWADRPNPLDEIALPEIEPEANGHFGPFGSAPLTHRNFNGSP